MQVFVRTKQGWGSVIAAPIVSRGTLFYLTQPATLRLPDGKTQALPSGTLMRADEDLAARTRHKPLHERRTHIVFNEDDGIHGVDRHCRHIRVSERIDDATMIMRHEDVARIARRIVSSGQMDLLVHLELQEKLSEIRTSFDEWKRNPHKKTVRARLDTAKRQKAKSGKLKVAPAALTAFASTPHIRKRLNEVRDIFSAMGACLLRVDDLNVDIGKRIGVAWNFVLQGEVHGFLPPAIELALDRKTRSRDSVREARIVLGQVRKALDAVRVQPYGLLANDSIVEIDLIERAVRQDRRDLAVASMISLRRMVRRMRMIRYIALQLLEPLAFPRIAADRTESYSEEIQAQFAKNLQEACNRVKDMQDHELDGDLRAFVWQFFDAVGTCVIQREFGRARDELKYCIRSLREFRHEPSAQHAA